MRLSAEKIQELNNYKDAKGKAYFSQSQARNHELSARIQTTFDTIAEGSLSPFYHFALHTLDAGDYLYEDIMENAVGSIYYYVRRKLNLPITQVLKDQRRYEEEYILNMRTLFELLVKQVVDINKVEHMERVFNGLKIEILSQTFIYALTGQVPQEVRMVRGDKLHWFADQLCTLPTEEVDTRVVERLRELADLLCATIETSTQPKTTEQLKAQKAVEDFKVQFLAAYNAKNK